MANFFGLFGCDEEEEEGEYKEEDEEMEDGEELADAEDERGASLPIFHLENESKPTVKKDDQKEALKMEQLAKSNLCCICNSNDIKYRCPGCRLRTCSLGCCKKHKEVFTCDGQRDRCPYLKISEFSDKNLVDDYFFLEEANSAIESAARKRRNICKSGMAQMGELPNWMKKLRYEARIRGTRIKFLPAGFKRRLRNHTSFMYREKVIEWTLEWLFLLDEDDTFKIIEDRVSESELLIDRLTRLIEKSQLARSKVDLKLLPQVILFIRHETSKFFTQVDINDALCKVLLGKSILEYPSFVVTLPKYAHRFQVLPSPKMCPSLADASPSCSSRDAVTVDAKDAPVVQETFHNSPSPLSNCLVKNP